MKFLWKFKKNILWGVGGCLSLRGGQGGCERRIEDFVIFKKNSGGGVFGLQCQDGCERRIEVFVKIKKKSFFFFFFFLGGGGGGVREGFF